MASESEIEAAAERTVRWQVACGDGTHEQHEYGSDPDLQRADESALVDWAVARLAADRAEREERARPIDADRVVAVAAKLRNYDTCNDDDVDEAARLLLDLPRVLKGSA